MTWSNTDPRRILQKSQNIVIVYPSAIQGERGVTLAYVDLENDYMVCPDWPHHRSIDTSVAWNPLWQWTVAP